MLPAVIVLASVMPCASHLATIKTALGDVNGWCSNENGCHWLQIPYSNTINRFDFSKVRSEPYPSGGAGSTDVGPACMQFASAGGGATRIPQDEQCLSLNIWSPPNSTLATTAKRPVMVFIHEGGFFTGATLETFYNGTTLASHGALVVSLNYRLGILGSFLLPDGSGGALGLGDQITALKWVRSFIHNFGGDPDLVTVFGLLVAGGSSVCCLLHSPLASGLFRRAIVESGVCFPSVGLVLPLQDAKNASAALLRQMNVSPAELRTMPATELINRTMNAPMMNEPRSGGLGSPFADGRVLSDVPLSLPPLPGVDVMIGMTSFDGPAVTAIPRGRSAYFAHWLGAASASQILSHYKSSDRDLDIFHDACITCQSAALARRMAQDASSRVFVYLYDFPNGTAKHCAELKAVWGKNGTSKTDPPPALRSLVHKLWVSFATTGTPNFRDGTSGPSLNWPQVDPLQSLKAQVLGLQPRVVEFEGPACAGWVASADKAAPLHISAMCSSAGWGATANLQAWLELGTRRIMPNAKFPGAAQLTPSAIALARNEVESFQLALRHELINKAGTPVTLVEVSTSVRNTATGDTDSGLAISWSQVGHVLVEHIYTNPQGSDGTWWPDPLLPRADGKALVMRNMTCPLFFDVRASPQTDAGNYTIVVTLQWQDGAMDAETTLNVAVRVFGFSLPQTLSLKNAFDLSQSQLNRSYHFANKSALHTMWMKYARFVMTEYRLNPGTIYAEPALMAVDEAKELVSLGMNHFTIARVPTTLDAAKAQAAALGPYVAELRAANLTAPGLLGVYGFDEADQTKESAAIAAVFGMYKAKFPEVDTMTTAHMQAGTDGAPEQDPTKIKAWHVDHMCPVLDWIVPRNMSSCLAQGQKMWFYTSCEPLLPAPNLRLDNPLLDARIIFWLAQSMAVDGFLYWGFNAWPEGPSLAPIDLSTSPLLLDVNQWSGATCRKCATCSGKCWAPNLEQIQGDGKLLYASTQGPIGSIRLAAIRDGLEDAEYLAMLRRLRGQSEVRTMTHSIADFSDYDHSGKLVLHTEDPAFLAARRFAIGEQLEHIFQSAA
jgi:para-nitrobenzyl esterase